MHAPATHHCTRRQDGAARGCPRPSSVRRLIGGTHPVLAVEQYTQSGPASPAAATHHVKWFESAKYPPHLHNRNPSRTRRHVASAALAAFYTVHASIHMRPCAHAPTVCVQGRVSLIHAVCIAVATAGTHMPLTTRMRRLMIAAACVYANKASAPDTHAQEPLPAPCSRAPEACTAS